MMAFAAHHARLGASEIHIYLDRPNTALAAALSKHPALRITQCDDAFWRAHGGRAQLQTKRQDVIANLAYDKAGVDWLAHIDADEFISARALKSELAAMPASIPCIRLPVRERAWGAGAEPSDIFDGFFRVPVPGKLGLDRHFLKHLGRFTQRGVTGHTRGKTFARRGAGLRLSIHSPYDAEDIPFLESQSMRLLHFDGLTPFHWLLKRLRYASLPHADEKLHADNYRWNQIAALREFATVWEARRFQRRLTTLNAEREMQFRALGLVEDAPGFDPERALSAVYPDQQIDLSVEAFDEALRTRDKDLVAALGLLPAS